MYIFRCFFIWFLFSISLTMSASAELLLLEKGMSGNYQAIQYESTKNQKEIDSIFSDILLKYQWPMVTMFFHEFTPKEQGEYLKALENENGVFEFISKKIQSLYQDKYKIVFIPTTLFEMSVLNKYAQDLIASTSIPSGPFGGKSIFPPTDLRNGYFQEKFFEEELSGKILKGIRELSKNRNKNTSANVIQHAFRDYNLNSGVKELYFRTTSYLMDKYTLKILENLNKPGPHIKNMIKREVETFLKNEKTFSQHLKNKDTMNYYDYNRNKNISKLPYLETKDIPLLEKAALADIKAAEKNKFLLFRGTNGFVINEDNVERGQQEMMDLPFRELSETYEIATTDSPPHVKKILPIQTSKPLYEYDMSFLPSSLSLGNSLLAGTVHEISRDQGARSLDFMRTKKIGYFLDFFIKDYLSPQGIDLTLQQKYLISPLHPIAALFSRGELFHSRSKISLVMQGRKWSGNYNGIAALGTTKKALLEDQATFTGFFITPGIDWRELNAQIVYDIANKTNWMQDGNDTYKDLLLTTQKNAGYFTSMEVEAFKVHLEKFRRVLSQIAPNHSPDIERDHRPYDEDNTFWKLIHDPSFRKTSVRLETQSILAFDDLLKRTKEHILVIPKGRYISFPNFIDQAQTNEIVNFFRSISDVAEKLSLDKTGYRIITNHSINPGSEKNNDAKQEVPHFHVHLAGGECLGMSVAGTPLSVEPKKVVSPDLADMDISVPPYGFGLSQKQFLQDVFFNKLYEVNFTLPSNESRKLVAYRMPVYDKKIPHFVGFVLLDQHRKPLYRSIHDFCKTASSEEMVHTLKFINDVAKSVGIYKTGFRLVAGHGKDAWSLPEDIMTIAIAGGNTLGVTVTNVWGNRQSLADPRSWNKKVVSDYGDLLDMTHDHCPIYPGDQADFMEKIATTRYKIKNFKDLTNKFKSLTSLFNKNFPKFKENVSNELKGLKSGTIRHAYLKNVWRALEKYHTDNGKIERAVSQIEPILMDGHKNPDDDPSCKEIFGQLNESYIKTLESYMRFIRSYDKTYIWPNNPKGLENLGLVDLIHSECQNKWIFVDLDFLMENNSPTFISPNTDLIEILKELQQKGYKIIGLTNMKTSLRTDEHSGKDTSLQDKLNFLKSARFKFSNPGNLEPFESVVNSLTDTNNPSKFKDGIIFYGGDSKEEKINFLTQYLEILAKKDEEFPSEILFYTGKTDEVEFVKDFSSTLKIVCYTYLYKSPVLK